MDGKVAMPQVADRETRFTYEDLQNFPDDGLRHEIIDGVHYVTAAPNLRHQDILGRLHLIIGAYLEAHTDQGRVYLAPCDVVFSFHDVVEPDLVFVAPDQLDILTDKNVQGTPAMVVEILSPSTRKRDEQVKRRLYARFGVREYWVVDPELDEVKVYRRADDGRFPRVAELAAEDRARLTTPLIPGIEIPLERLFR